VTTSGKTYKNAARWYCRQEKEKRKRKFLLCNGCVGTLKKVTKNFGLLVEVCDGLKRVIEKFRFQDSLC
jgi:hypothetical protein